MTVVETAIPGALILEPRVFKDSRGLFYESWNDRVFRSETSVRAPFVQDNYSSSTRGVLRGLHYQIDHPQGKLVWVGCGCVFDVVVDLRRQSPTFSKWVGVELSDDNNRMMWLPPGLAHGFLVLSDRADFLYKVTDYYSASGERTLRWNDPALGIDWPLGGLGAPVLSEKDAAGAVLGECEVYPWRE